MTVDHNVGRLHPLNRSRSNKLQKLSNVKEEGNRNLQIGNKMTSKPIGYKKNVVLSKKGSTAPSINRKENNTIVNKKKL